MRPRRLSLEASRRTAPSLGHVRRRAARIGRFVALVSLASGLVRAPSAAWAADICGAGATFAFQGCSGIPADGCCDQARTSHYFCKVVNDEEITCITDCGAASCGWDCDTSGGECITWPAASGEYACGQSPAEPDETGEHPWTCPKLCAPSCGGKDCGDDGCGGTCGSCYSAPGAACPLSCNAYGKCDAACVDCAGLGWTCGSNCCGGNCGSCTPPAICNPVSHVCDCTANCTGKACGDDGCGGSCGDCPAAQVCDENGACVAAPLEPTPEAGAEPLDEVSDGATTETPRPADSAQPSDDEDTMTARDSQFDDGATEGDGSWGLSELPADGACPPGTSLVSGMCLKDPPAPGPGSTKDGGCSASPWGSRAPSPLFPVSLVLLLVLGLSLSGGRAPRGGKR